MKILNRIKLKDIKDFLNIAVEEFNIEDYQYSLIYKEEENKLICLVINDTIYGKIEFYESEVYINGEIDYELSFDWCTYLNYIFGLIYKRLFIETLQNKYNSNNFIFIPRGIPQDVSIMETLKAINEKALQDELEETETLFSILESEEDKWKNIPRKAIVRRKR